VGDFAFAFSRGLTEVAAELDMSEAEVCAAGEQLSGAASWTAAIFSEAPGPRLLKEALR
jgi:hypothetical protein